MNWQLAEIGAELGMSVSGAHELIEGFKGVLHRLHGDGMRAELLASLAIPLRVLEKDLGHREPKVRHSAARTISRLIHEVAVVSGVVKQAPPVVMVNQFSQGPDLSRLSIEEVETLQRIQTKLLEAPIVAHGEVVEDVESERGEVVDERGGAAGGLADRP